MNKTGFQITFDDGVTQTEYLQPLFDKGPFKIELNAKNSDRKDGKFGFDTIPDKNIVQKNYENLKQTYNPLLEKILEEEYIPNWLSIRKDQTVELDIEWFRKRKANGYETISFEPHDDFTFEPENLKGANKVKITCKNTNEATTQIQIKADDELIVGALNIFYPKPKKIDLEYCFIEIQGDEGDKKSLQNKIDKNKLESHMTKGLNPSLIDFRIINEDPTVIDVSESKENLKSSGVLKKHLSIGDYIERQLRAVFLNKIKAEHTKLNTEIITVYFINQKCMFGKDIKEDGTFKVSGGFSPTGTGIAYLVLDPNSNISSENIIHEVMHALGLKHSFDSEYDYSDHKTDNYMDYQNTKKHTYKWQWEKLHEYSKLK